jgi:predicted translin family RNA/ssDNA-binding protein
MLADALAATHPGIVVGRVNCEQQEYFCASRLCVAYVLRMCCRCKRIASQVSMLADALAATHPDIVVGRVNCEQQEYFCAHVIKISRTPSFKVGFKRALVLSHDS